MPCISDIFSKNDLSQDRNGFFCNKECGEVLKFSFYYRKLEIFVKTIVHSSFIL